VSKGNPAQNDKQDLIRDLTLTDPSEDLNALRRKKGRRAANTCEWILKTEFFTTWLCPEVESGGQSNSISWLYGNPGTGKSTMAIFLTEELLKVFSRTSGQSLVYFFCDSSFDKRNTATAVVRGLLLQLVQQHQKLFDFVSRKYGKRGGTLFDSFDAVWTVFEDVIAKADGQLFCIIDALDECDKNSQMTLLQQLEVWQHSKTASNLRILITSRPYPEIRDSLAHFAKTSDLATFPESKQDVSRFIDNRMTILQQRKNYTAHLITQIERILREKSQETFLWVGLACEELSNMPSKNAIKFLQKLPTGLFALYKSLLHTAIQEHQADSDIIKRILSFVTVARSPFGILELSEACELYSDTKDKDTRIQFMREEIASCRLMVIVQDGKVHLLHQSIKDFLIGPGAEYFLDELQAHADVASRCLDKIIWSFHNPDNISNVHSRGNEGGLNNFTKYSQKFWPVHAHMADTKFKIRASHEQFFAFRSPILEQWFNYMGLHQSSILHVAARWGIPILVDHICPKDSQTSPLGTDAIVLDSIGSGGRTPLEEAICNGNTIIISLLLQKGASVTTKVLETAVAAVADDMTIKVVLERRGNQLSLSEASLLIIAKNFSETTIQFLFDQWGDQIIITEAFFKAIALNYTIGEATVRLLLDRGADQIPVTEALACVMAERFNKESMVLILDRLGDRIKITQAVVEAAAGNYKSGEAVMGLLVDRQGTQIQITNAVLEAAGRNYESGEAVIRLLLNRCGDQLTISTAIMPVVVGSFDKVTVGLLLERCKTQITLTDVAVESAAGNSEHGEAILRLIFNRREQITISKVAIAIIFERFNTATIQLLLDKRRDQVSITETVVMAAAKNHACGVAVFTLLFDRCQIPDTEVAIAAAIRSPKNGEAIIKLFLDQDGSQITITKAIVIAAAENGWNGEAFIRLLLCSRKDQGTITKAAVFLIAKAFDRETVRLLLDSWGDHPTLLSIIVSGAAENSSGHGKEIIQLLFDRGVHRDQISMTEAVVQAAAGNLWEGEAILGLLFDRWGDQVPVTEAVVVAAVKNTARGEDVVRLLLDRRKSRVPVNNAVARAVQENHWNGNAIIGLVLD
jgi:Cdc6-like AAA superfamily ATPase